LSRTYSSADLYKVCTRLGWQLDRQSGSHLVLVKPGQPRPIVIPAGRKDLAPFIVSKIVHQLGIGKTDLAEYL